jgi:ATP-dependent helicase HrpA
MSEAPTVTYPTDLPVSARREDIQRAIREHQVVILAGATGSGKTTQLPKMLLELGYESIAHTQPRRIAARTIAERISGSSAPSSAASSATRCASPTRPAPTRGSSS